jgi:hypothetical protein
MDSGLDLGAAFLDQRTADFLAVPQFAPQDSFPTMPLSPAMPGLCQQPVPQELQGVAALRPMFPPTDSNMAPEVAPQMMFCDIEAMGEEGFDDLMGSLRQ